MTTYTRKSRRSGQESAASKPLVMDCDQHSRVAGWRRRQHAARRVMALDCGCPDPWPCRCSQPPLSDKIIDGGRDAALHILESGRVPSLKIEVLQALWRRGGADREVAQLLHELTDGALA